MGYNPSVLSPHFLGPHCCLIASWWLDSSYPRWLIPPAPPTLGQLCVQDAGVLYTQPKRHFYDLSPVLLMLLLPQKPLAVFSGYMLAVHWLCKKFKWKCFMYFSSQILFSFFWHSSSAYQNIFNLLLLSVFQQFEILARSGRALWCFTGRFPSVTQSHQPTQSFLKGPHHLVRFHSPFLHR